MIRKNDSYTVLCESCKKNLVDEHEYYVMGCQEMRCPPIYIYFCKSCFEEIAGEEYTKSIKMKMKTSPLARRRTEEKLQAELNREFTKALGY